MLVGLLGGCATPAETGGGAQSSPSPTPGATELTITVTATPTAPVQTWTLSCAPVAGTHPNAATACAFVSHGSADLLAPVPAGLACAQIFGGPAVATVKGTWQGKSVDARFARNDGCEVARWDALKPLIGAGAA